MPINRELYTTNFYNDANLLYYYRFEGNSNDSKGSNNGSDTAITYGTSYGKFGQGANFNGSSSGIIFNNLSIASSNFTVSIWIYTTSTGSYICLFRAGGTGVTGVVIESDGTNVFFRLHQHGPLGTTFTTDVNFCPTADLSKAGWKHFVAVNDVTANKVSTYVDGKLANIGTWGRTTASNNGFVIGYGGLTYFTGNLDDLSIFSRALSDQEVLALYGQDKNRYIAGIDGDAGTYPSADNNSLDTSLIAWKRLQPLLRKSVNGGQCFKDGVVSTYPLIHTITDRNQGGVLTLNGDIHFVPYSAVVGQKISASGVVSTYSLVYTTAYAYIGGVLAPNGDIHFVPLYAAKGQKISASGVVSTYSLAYTTSLAYQGGVLASNGDIHFVPYRATIGQKISTSGLVSTYSLIYTVNDAYVGGVLAPNGDTHFIPRSATVGQKVSSSGAVSTYSLAYTIAAGYFGGVLSSNGDIHFVPTSATVGQKISSSGLVSTYSLVYTVVDAYIGGVLAPNGDIHFVPFYARVGQKVSSSGVVSTYSLAYTLDYAFSGGILTPNGDIYFIPYNATVGQKISTLPGIPFDQNICLSPFFNKL